MDGRESMALSGSSSYYLHRGVSGSGSASGSITHTGFNTPPDFRPETNPNFSIQPNVRDGSVGSTFPVQSSSPSFPHGFNMGVSSGVPMGEPGKKKRGRPRKYGPDGTNMSLGLSPMPTPPAGSEKRGRGRPRGSGWKQKLAPLGEWMNNSAGLAFTPHIINIAVGEDIASNILSFSQQRPRAVCILSASGAVSAVTLRQPTSSGNTVTYEGRFQILCLSGSYLVAESGGPRNRTGGISVSLCSPDGHVIGGGVGGVLIAGSPVQVVVCSFVYGGSKSKNKSMASPSEEQNSELQPSEKPVTPASAVSGKNLTPSSGVWPSSRPDMRDFQTEIDLTRG
ncbi:AT-hook motif nuclear-localized protein 5-like [Actinidia eriantha]|uniref:AT-hook motif nuclear-localized protein 5-like n=1 Tax=Actinidia eriantha TaxID=165200 RepID=UPI0025891F37|nr:AT-hook motif nuclear-localized protein 5-like [Actinidia eriantha]